MRENQPESQRLVNLTCPSSSQEHACRLIVIDSSHLHFLCLFASALVFVFVCVFLCVVLFQDWVGPWCYAVNGTRSRRNEREERRACEGYRERRAETNRGPERKRRRTCDNAANIPGGLHLEMGWNRRRAEPITQRRALTLNIRYSVVSPRSSFVWMMVESKTVWRTCFLCSYFRNKRSQTQESIFRIEEVRKVIVAVPNNDLDHWKEKHGWKTENRKTDKIKVARRPEMDRAMENRESKTC